MRRILWTLVFSAVVALTAVGVRQMDAQAQSVEELEAERAKVAKEALAKAVKRGKELWTDKKLLGAKKSCMSCHEDADKPKDNLAKIDWSYPAYSRRLKGVVTLSRKINEMIKYRSRGKELALDSDDLAALAAYLMSIKGTQK
jgi:cytochrome c